MYMQQLFKTVFNNSFQREKSNVYESRYVTSFLARSWTHLQPNLETAVFCSLLHLRAVESSKFFIDCEQTKMPRCVSCGGTATEYPERYFHSWPKDTSLADKWNAILKIPEEVLAAYKSRKLCSVHFKLRDEFRSFDNSRSSYYRSRYTVTIYDRLS